MRSLICSGTESDLVSRCPATRLHTLAQLIEAQSGYHLWSETYDRKLEDVFAIQDEISLAIAEALKAELALDDDFAELWAARSILARARNDAEQALEFAERALAIRPNHVDALSWRVNPLADVGRYAESFAARDEMLELDPLSVIGRLNAVTTLSQVEPERAEIMAQSVAAQSPWASYLALARVYAAQGVRILL